MTSVAASSTTGNPMGMGNPMGSWNASLGADGVFAGAEAVIAAGAGAGAGAEAGASGPTSRRAVSVRACRRLDTCWLTLRTRAWHSCRTRSSSTRAAMAQGGAAERDIWGLLVVYRGRQCITRRVINAQGNRHLSVTTRYTGGRRTAPFRHEHAGRRR